MAALLVMLAVMAVMMTVAIPTWRHMVQREKEEELVFRGQQYVRAISLFQRKYAASFPPDVDTLVAQKFLRKKYKDPMTASGEFEILYQTSLLNTGQGGSTGRQRQSGSSSTTMRGSQGSAVGGTGTLGPRGGVVGVASKSTETSIRVYYGRTHYNEWPFVFAGAGRGGPGRGGAGRRQGGTRDRQGTQGGQSGVTR